MTLADSSDTALIGQLRANLERAATELADWRAKAESALAAAETLGARVIVLEAEVETLRCGDLFAFHDGGLEEPRAGKFRVHLASCARCQEGLIHNQQLDARISALAQPRAPK